MFTRVFRVDCVCTDPTHGHIPQEGLIAAEIVKELEPYSAGKGGPLQIELLEYVPGRPNVLVKLPADSPEPTTCAHTPSRGHKDANFVVSEPARHLPLLFLA
jgi:hypothetical protein